MSSSKNDLANMQKYKEQLNNIKKEEVLDSVISGNPPVFNWC
jgi:hypothetical protein